MAISSNSGGQCIPHRIIFGPTVFKLPTGPQRTGVHTGYGVHKGGTSQLDQPKGPVGLDSCLNGFPARLAPVVVAEFGTPWGT